MSEPRRDRDGPTPEWAGHHDTTRRRNGGERVYTRLEQMMDSGTISPQECDAGHRYGVSYALGVLGSQPSLMFRSGGSSTGGPDVSRLDHTTAFREAAEALDRYPHLGAGGMRASEVALLLCYHDLSLSEIGRQIGRHKNTVRERLKDILAILAVHYAGIGRRDGRDVTLYTVAAVKARLDPNAEEEARPG